MLSLFSPFAPRFSSVARSLSAIGAVLASAVVGLAQTPAPSAADGFDPNVDGNVYAVATQPDGKILIAGQFGVLRPGVGDIAVRNNIARLNPDGSVDQTFDPNVNGPIRALVMQPDGRILIGGEFTSLQPSGSAAATPRTRVARLNANGTVDATFNPNVGGGFTPQVYALLLQADGRIVVGGGFTTVQPNGATSPTTRNRLARFNADGTLDTGFNPNPNNIVFALAPHVDKKILVGGAFTNFQANGATDPTTRNRIARLNPDGTPDSEFDPNADNRVLALAVQRDGKILIGGDFATVQPIGSITTSRSRIARLNSDGTFDAAFDGNASGSVQALAIQPDGRLLVGGAFNSVWANGSSLANHRFIARFNPDGSLDAAFDPGINNVVDAFAFQADGQVVIGGYFTGMQPLGSGTSFLRNRVARLNPDGMPDTTLNLDAGGRVLVSAVQKDGKILIGGSFTSVGGVTHFGMARLNADGSVDPTFTAVFDQQVLAIVVQPDGKILVGGAFTTIGGEPRNHIARLNPSGTIDSEFNPNADNVVGVLALQADGKILLAGSFTNVQPLKATLPSNRRYLARLNADGSLDTPFHPNPDNIVTALTVLSDNKILVGGTFNVLVPDVDLTPVTNLDGTVTIPTGTSVTRARIAKLNTDGTADTTYLPGANAQVNAFAVQTDGKVVIAGLFVSVRGSNAETLTDRFRLARLNADGTLDAAYNPTLNNAVDTMALQADGKLLIGGPFTTVTPNGAATYTLRKYAARINTDGTVDAAFNLDLNEKNGNRVDSLVVQSDGKILMTGTFDSLQPVGAPVRIARNHFARINTDGTLDAAFLPGVGGTVAAQIKALAVQADGKLVVGGAFTDFGGARSTNVARFLPTGAPDQSFDPNLAADGPVNALLLRLEPVATVPQGTGFAWLNADGSVRTAFSPTTDSRINGTIQVIAPQSDGNILVGGTFTTAVGFPAGNLVRYSPTGVLDLNFGPNPSGGINAMVVQPNGQILVGGGFTTIAGLTRNFIARINPDGSLDTTFDPNASASVSTIVLQPDGKILIGGAFTTLTPNGSTTTTTTTTTSTPNAANSTNTVTNADGSTTTTTISTLSGTTTTTVVTIIGAVVARNYIARLNPDGTVDAGFNPTANASVAAIAVQSDGKIVIGGAFTTLTPNGATTAINRRTIARLNTDGTVDSAYDPNPSSTATITALILQPDGKVLVSGSFTSLSPNGATAGITRNYLARLNPDATVDPGFDPNLNSPAFTISLQADGRILLAGAFTSLKPNGSTVATTRNRLARINGDGSLDTGFNPNANSLVNTVIALPDTTIVAGGAFTEVQPNGVLFVGGAFNNIGGVPSRNLALLIDDGTVSSLFQPNPNGAVNALLAQPDAKIVVAGAFTSLAGATRNRLARFNADATLDTAFNPNVGGPITALSLQPDGKIVIAGAFTTVGGQARNGLARLNADGSLDTSFTSTLGAPNSAIIFTGLAVQPDGRILVGGTLATGFVARLVASGATDSTFSAPDFSAASVVNGIALQVDGKILVAGSFTTAGGAPVGRLARLNANGTVDATFNPAPNNTVTALALQADGRVVLGGAFSTVGGLPREGLARLSLSATSSQSISASATTVLWARGGNSPELTGVSFERSLDTQTWFKLGPAGRASGSGNWQLGGLSLPTSGLFYIRARGVTPSSAGVSAGIIETVREFNLAAVAGVGPSAASGTATIAGLSVDLSTGIISGQTTQAGPTDAQAAAIGAAAAAAAVNGAFSGTASTTGATSGTVVLPATQPVQIGLPVAAADAIRFTNFSARARVTTDNPIILGFAVSGTAARPFLFRAVGPGLASFNVAGTLAAPRLQIYDGAHQLVVENNGWAGSADVAAAAARTAAFPLAPGSTDAAAVVTLPPGTYSVLVLDGSGAGGVVLAEVYDAGDSTGSSRLVNVSSRGNVTAGDGAFITGFVVTGVGSRSALVRGVGPGLAQYIGAGTLADPVATVYNAGGFSIASNDNWSASTIGSFSPPTTVTASSGSSSGVVTTTAATTVGAFPLETGSKDAALSVILVPGAYSVQVSGNDGTAGTALAEVYLP